MIVPARATCSPRRERFDSDMVTLWLSGSSPRRGAQPSRARPGQGCACLLPKRGECAWTSQGVPRAQLANADLAPTPSKRSPLFHGRRPVQLGRIMRRETSQAGNRARKTCRRFRRGEHAGELGAGPPEVLLAGDRYAHFGSPLVRSMWFDST